ncbi:MAG: hypothetical protein ACOXZK_05080 [Bacteroidales bacterium]
MENGVVVKDSQYKELANKKELYKRNVVMNICKLIVFVLFPFMVAQAQIYDPVSPEIKAKPDKFELFYNDIENPIKGYVRVVLSFKDSTSPLLLESVEIAEIAFLDSNNRDSIRDRLIIIYDRFSKNQMDNRWVNLLDIITDKVKNVYFYIDAGECVKHFDKRTYYLFPFVIKSRTYLKTNE